MTKYEKLLAEYDDLDISEHDMINKGLYADETIWIKKDLPETEKACILAEELGHYHTTVGDILDQKDTRNTKQERRARAWAYNCLIPLEDLRDAWEAAKGDFYEMTESLDVSTEFLQECLDYYEGKYGPGFLEKESQAEALIRILSGLSL